MSQICVVGQNRLVVFKLYSMKVQNFEIFVRHQKICTLLKFLTIYFGLSVSSTENLFIFITAFILVAITTVNLTVGITGTTVGS